MDTEIHNQLVVTRKEKPNTYEIGKAGNRHNIAYDTPEDLLAQITKLKEMGLLQEEAQ